MSTVALLELLEISHHRITPNKLSAFLLYGSFCLLMGQITLQYVPFNTDTAFLRIKQQVIGLPHYQFAFFIHVYASMFVLVAGATQFSTKFLQCKPQWHRRFGWLYVVIIAGLEIRPGCSPAPSSDERIPHRSLVKWAGQFDYCRNHHLSNEEKTRNESILLLATSVLFGCQSGPSESLTVYIDVAEDTITVVEALATNGASLQESQVPGYYTGKFTNVELNPSDEHIAANRITLIIEAFHDGMVIGKSVVAGNERPFSGTYQRTDGIYQVRAEEPGDDRYDGVFTFTISDSMFPLRGDWRANDQSLKGNHKRYGLEKKIFRYNPSLALPNRVSGSYVGENAEIDELGEAELITEDVLRVNPSMQLLNNEDIENMYVVCPTKVL